MRSLVMSDVETGTEWSHLLGRAMAGKLKGKELTPLITDMVTWDVWKREYPTTTALNMSRTSRNYSRDFYRDPSRFVFGFEEDGQAWTLAMNQLLKHPVHPFKIGDEPLLATFDARGSVTRLFSRVVGGRTLDFEQVDAATIRDHQSKTRWSIVGGIAIDGEMKGKRLTPHVGIMSFRKAWKNFHPDSRDVAF